MPAPHNSRFVEALAVLAFLLTLAVAALYPLRNLGWESVDEIDFIHAGRSLDRTLAREGPLAVWNEVLLEPGIGRIRPVTYLYLWLSLRFADYSRPQALVVHAIPLVALGWLAFLWCRAGGARRGLALAAGGVPLMLANQQGNWSVTILAEPLLALLGLATLVALRAGEEARHRLVRAAWYASALAGAGLCLLTKEPGIAIVPVLVVHALRAGWPGPDGRRRDRVASLGLGAGAAALVLAYLLLWTQNQGAHTYSASYARAPLAMTRNVVSASVGFVQELWLPSALLPIWLLVAAGWSALSPGAAASRYWGALALLWGAGTVLALGPWGLFSIKNYFPALIAFSVGGALLAGPAGLPESPSRRAAVALAAALLAFLLLSAATGSPPGRCALQAAPVAFSLGVAITTFAASAAGNAGRRLRAGLALLVVPQLLWALALGERAVIATGYAIARRSAPQLAALDLVALHAPRNAVVEVYLQGGAANPLAVRASGFYGHFLEDYLAGFGERADLTLRFRELSEWGRAPEGAVQVGGAWSVPFARARQPAHQAPGQAGYRVLVLDRAENLVDPFYFAVQCRDALLALLTGGAPVWPRLALVYDFGYREWDVATGTRQVAK